MTCNIVAEDSTTLRVRLDGLVPVIECWQQHAMEWLVLVRLGQPAATELSSALWGAVDMVANVRAMRKLRERMAKDQPQSRRPHASARQLGCAS